MPQDRVEGQLAYLERRRRAAKKLWSRTGTEPEIEGMRVLDLACGHGAFTVELLMRGAAQVQAIDPIGDTFRWARLYIERHAPHLVERVCFEEIDVIDFQAPEPFDLIVCLDAFEHMADPEAALRSIESLLAPGGLFFTGFGPLWNSPFGAHGRARMPLPWLHLLLPERALLAWVGLFEDRKPKSIEDMGMNRWALRDFERLFRSSPLEIVFFRVNHGDNFPSRVFRFLSRFRPLREFFGHDIYCVMRRPQPAVTDGQAEERNT